MLHRKLALSLCAVLCLDLCLQRFNTSQAQNAAITINVDAAANRHAINPMIYGVAFADTAMLNDLNVPSNRNGGTLTVSTQFLTLASFGGASGVVSLTGSSITNLTGTTGIIVGEGGTGVLNVSGTAALNVSAPPPGKVSRPASRSARSTSRQGIFSMREMWAISTAVSALMCTCGKFALRARNISL